MHRIVVEEKGWISESRFLFALQYCMLLPGPEAQQLATFLGWRLHGLKGGLFAGLLFVLPGFCSILVLSYVYLHHHQDPILSGAFCGLRAAVIGVVLQAAQRIGRRVLTDARRKLIGVLAFGISLSGLLPFPLLVLGAALFGAWAFSKNIAAEVGVVLPSLRDTLLRIGFWGTIWWAPLLGVFVTTGIGSVWSQLGLFFSKTAVVTFGGAYAVLGMIAEGAVVEHSWLNSRELADGLSLAESTPGPLIQVVQFVGYLAAARSPSELHPDLAGFLGSLLVTHATFAPCFLWIFAGAPWMEWLRVRPGLQGAFAGISAAVAGVVLHFALRLSEAAWMSPQGEPIWLAIGLSLLSGWGLLVQGRSMGSVLVAAALLGAALGPGA
jgi:chromate transporter